MMKLKLLTFLLVLLTGCYNKSYYEVANINEQRHGGWQLENAQFLNESYDLILLVGDMSTLAQKRSTFKESYLLAQNASKISKSLCSNYKMEAIRLRVKFTSELSKTQEEYYHRLGGFPDENFDLMYTLGMQAKLKELDLKMKSYTASGKNERLVELADEVQDAFRSLHLDFNQMNQKQPGSFLP